MSKTINGMTLKEVFEKFQEDLPSEAIQIRDYDDVLYISVDNLRKRLDEVIGPEHYNEHYSDIELVSAKDTIAIKCKCTLELLDDDFNVILVKESAGGNTLAFPKIDEKVSSVDGDVRTFTTIKKQDGKPNQIVGLTINSIPNDLDSACQDAFKRICKKQLGIGRRQLEIAENGILYVVFVKSYKKTEKGHVFCDIEWNGQPYKFACFAKQVKELENRYGSERLSGKIIAFYGKEGKDGMNNPQLIFSKPGEVPEEFKKPNYKPSSKSTTNNAPVQTTAPSNSPQETPAQTSTTQSNTNGRKVLKFKSRSALIAITGAGYEGSFKMDCDLDGSTVKVYFLAEYIGKMDQQKWNMFKKDSEIKYIDFTVECCEKNGSYYVADFK